MAINKISEELLRSTMANFATGVTIITAKDHDHNRLCGFTANSFCSLSLQPALVSFSLHKESPTIPAIMNSNKFAINILSKSQEELARHFAKYNNDKLAGLEYELGDFSQAPLIKGAICHIECDVWQVYAGGDHEICIGQVEDNKVNNEDEQFMYFRRNYCELK